MTYIDLKLPADIELPLCTNQSHACGAGHSPS